MSGDEAHEADTAPDAEGLALDWSARFGQHVESARHRAMLSRSQLAARIDVTEETIRRWERGGARPSSDRLAQLIVVLAIDARSFSALPSGGQELQPFARLLQDERAQRGISQAHAGRLIGVAQPTYAGWEIGRATPERRFVPGLAEFLGVTERQTASLLAAPFVVDTTHWPPLGRVMGARRAALQLTREELATRLGVSGSTIAAWELGYRAPRAQQVAQLAAALGVDVARVEGALPLGEHLPALGRLINSRQRLLGLRRADIAERTGVDEATLSRWIHGHHVPRPRGLRRLAAALEMPLSSLSAVVGAA